MILVTVTKKMGVELATPYDLALDPEKIVNTRVLDGVTQIDYAETFDRNREEITYEVTAAKPNIDATITGDYTTHTYLNLVVYWSDNKDLIPFPAISSTYTLSMQEKYIVDIQDVPFEMYWKNQKISTTVRKVRFVPGAFKQEVIYVTNHLHDLVDNIPSETTTTTTAVPVTTTTTLAPPQCPEGAVYSGWLTVGTSDGAYGYSDEVGYGSVSEPFPLGGCEGVGLVWDSETNVLYLFGAFGCSGNVTVTIDGDSYEFLKASDCLWTTSQVLVNPFAEVGAVLPICINCSEVTTTTTDCDVIYLSNYYYVDSPQNAVHFGDTLEDACDVMQQAIANEVDLLFTWGSACYMGEGNYYMTDRSGGAQLTEGYYIYVNQGYFIYYVNEFGMSTLTNTDCPTTTTTTPIQ